MPGTSPRPPGGLLLPPLQQQLLGSSDEVKVFKDEGEQDQQELSASESLQAELLGEKSGGWLLEPEHLARPPPPGFPWAVAPFPPHPGAHFPPLYPPVRPSASAFYNQQALSLQAAYSHQLAAWRGAPPPPYYLPLHPGAPPPPLLPPHPLAPSYPLGVPDKLTEGSRPVSPRKREPHIKKPLNAFMLFMKEMRPVVQAECTLKESAAINQVLGRRWHNLSRAEQAEYYERARVERARHMERYPDWNARDNYRHSADTREKKKKRKLEKMSDPAAGMKKCRARYGVDQPELWCQPCKRKKKCVRVQMYLANQEQAQEEADVDDPLPPAPSSGSDGEAGSPGSGFSDHSSSLGGSPGPPDWAGSPLSPLMPPASIGPPNRSGRVGSDPRDSNNPLSVSSLTSSCRMAPSPVQF